MHLLSAVALLAAGVLVDAQCSRCTSGETCYVSTWAEPCFSPAGGQSSCSAYKGTWCSGGGAPPPPAPVPSSGCSACSSGETCHVSTWSAPCFSPAGGQSSCSAYKGTWCGGGGAQPPTPPAPVPPPPSSSGCSACTSGETCHVSTWTVPCFSPAGGQSSCSAYKGTWCSGGGAQPPPPPAPVPPPANSGCSVCMPSETCYVSTWTVPCFSPAGGQSSCSAYKGTWCGGGGGGGGAPPPSLPAPVPPPASSGCPVCMSSETCYVSTWTVPCFTPAGGRSFCIAMGGAWCGGGSAPSPPSPPVSPLPPSAPSPSSGHDDRLVAYVGNWQTCPTTAQVSHYTHLMVAFAVTYTWSASGNICNTQCTISNPMICENTADKSKIRAWQAAGKKVLLSFGGAGMGGSWDGVNKCWEFCFGKEASVVSQLKGIVDLYGFDGVDIDYEYYYENNQGGSSFSKGAQAQYFLKEVTKGLKAAMPSKEISHAPMDADMVPGKAYFSVLKDVASSLDFIMVQYYNGITRPNTGGFEAAKYHYDNVVSYLFTGDAKKVVFGFCISDCSGTGSNIGSAAAVQVMTDLARSHRCNGGAGFWVALHDVSGSWSAPMASYLSGHNGC
ncbi:hypothetical protein DIPPA_30791 [Diplonema papillatum]|nr:hypothetical protein DIPPA_30791 [Diplonema papillatum]|eukprot:gene3593-5575_t